jgi:hypothetical protein
MARERKALWPVVLAWLVAGGTTAAELESGGTQQAFQQGRYGEALKQWEATLPRLRGDERCDTLLSMATAYRALGRVEKTFGLLKEAHALAERGQDKARQAVASLGGSTVAV